MEEGEYLIRSASVDITNNCNFKCLHCYNYSGEHNREEELSDEEVLKVFNELVDLQPDSLCICGGEPLLRLDLIYKICNLVKKKNRNISLNMVTNGYLLNDEIAFKLKENGLDLIQVSLDGASPETHNWLRNNNVSYDRTINAIKTSIKHGLKTNVACAPTRINFDEIDRVIELCLKLNVSLLRFQPLMIMGRGTYLKSYELTDEQYYVLAQKINSYNACNDKLKLEWGDPLQHIDNIAYTNKKNSCMDFSISAYGDIMISPYIPVTVGNVRKTDLVEYMKRNLQDIYSDRFIKKCACFIDSWGKMNLHNTCNYFPIIGLEKNINYDLIDIKNRDTELIMKIMNYREV